METKKWMFIDVDKRSNMISSTTFEPEGMYKAYTKVAHGRKVYISLDEIMVRDKDLGVKIFNDIFKPVNEDPT